jgi:hypothetical protein
LSYVASACDGVDAGLYRCELGDESLGSGRINFHFLARLAHFIQTSSDREIRVFPKANITKRQRKSSFVDVGKRKYCAG